MPKPSLEIGGIEFTNLDRLRNAITMGGKKAAKEAAKRLRNEAQEVLAKSRDLVPVDTGALKASGRVRPEVGVYTIGGNAEVWITYGSTAVDYAVYVHEDLGKYHPHGQAKFLEIPLVQQSYGLVDRIADRVEQVLKDELRGA